MAGDPTSVDVEAPMQSEVEPVKPGALGKSMTDHSSEQGRAELGKSMADALRAKLAVCKGQLQVEYTLYN